MAHDNGRKLLDEVQSIVRQLDFDLHSTENFFAYFFNALNGLTQDNPSQIPSYVRNLPTGKEAGLVLAVDLGGTNCRVCSVELHGDSTYTVRKSQESVRRNLRVNASYRPLFRSIALQIKDFLETHHAELLDLEPSNHNGARIDEKQTWKLGFVFSFTYIQTSLTQGEIVSWDKDWDIPEAIGKDPCVLLQQAIEELDLPVVVTALANDSVGTLVTRAYSAAVPGQTVVGAIFGTGTNAAYVERLDNIKKLKGYESIYDDASSEYMLVNTEWGNLDRELELLPQTSFDALLDKESTHPGEQHLEKRIAGLYLAELLRLILWDLWTRNFFTMRLGEDSPVLRREGLETTFLSQIAKSSGTRLQELVCSCLKAEKVSAAEASAIQILGAAVVRRSARLAGIALGSTITLSVYNKYGLWEDHPRIDASDTTSLLVRVFKFFGNLICPSDQWQKVTEIQSAQQNLVSSPKMMLSKLNGQLIDIGVDGSLIRYYPKYEALMREALRDIACIGPTVEAKIRISYVEDASAVGAALIALSSLNVTQSVF